MVFWALMFIIKLACPFILPSYPKYVKGILSSRKSFGWRNYCNVVYKLQFHQAPTFLLEMLPSE